MAKLAVLLEDGIEANGFTLDFMCYAQRLANGALGLVDLSGLKEDRPDEEKEAFEPFLISVAIHGPMIRNSTTGRLEETFMYPDISQGKTALQATVRAVVYLVWGLGCWQFTRMNYPSTDCWVDWQGGRWAMDGMNIIRDDHLPDVFLKWMDPKLVTQDELEAMAIGERVPAKLLEMTEMFASFQMDNGDVYVGAATLACEWRAYTWQIICCDDGRRIAEVLDGDGKPFAYLMPVHQDLVAEDRARFSNQYTTPAGAVWVKSEDGTRWTGESQGALVYAGDDGWWTPDTGPYQTQFIAMKSMDPEALA